MEESSQDGCQALIDPFQALKGNTLQRRALVQLNCHWLIIYADEMLRLEGLAKALTHHQIRALRSTIDMVDLRFDIIAKVPLEISQMILQFLPLYQIFQIRRVSSTWKQILSSPQTMQLLLQSWYPTQTPDTPLHIPQGLSENAILSLKAEHIDAYRTGHAFSYTTYDWNSFWNSYDYGFNPRRVTYANGVLAWADTTDGGSVRSLDLKNGHELSFIPDARTLISAIAMSSSMIAAVSAGRCHVWTLGAGDHNTLRLPSARFTHIAVSGGSLAVTTSYTWPAVEVVTWTLQDRVTSSFSLPVSPKTSNRSTMLDSQGVSFILFSQAYNQYGNEEPQGFHFIRTSLSGGILAQGFLEYPDSNLSFRSMNMHPKETRGHVILFTLYKPCCEIVGSWELSLISYDFEKDRLETCTLQITDPRLAHEHGLEIFYWKDVAYIRKFRGRAKGRPSLMILDLQESTYRKARTDFPADSLVNEPDSQSAFNPDEGEDEYDYLERHDCFLGDDIFLINANRRGFCVWNFDKNIKMIDENLAYKVERKVGGGDST